MINLNIIYHVPLGETNKLEKATRCSHEINLFSEGIQPYVLAGNWLLQDACGGYKWTTAINKWVI